MGDRIQFRRGGELHTAMVITIERCPRRGDKFGKPVAVLPWVERDFAYLTLDSGYCYGYEVVR